MIIRMSMRLTVFGIGRLPLAGVFLYYWVPEVLSFILNDACLNSKLNCTMFGKMKLKRNQMKSKNNHQKLNQTKRKIKTQIISDH